MILPFQLASVSKAYISCSAKTRIVGSNPPSLPPTRTYLLLSSVWATLAYSVIEQQVRGHIMTTFMIHSESFNDRVSAKHFVPLTVNPLNPELNPICYLLALIGAQHFLHVSRIRVKLLTFRLLMSYIYGAPILDVSRSHTTTQHSR